MYDEILIGIQKESLSMCMIAITCPIVYRQSYLLGPSITLLRVPASLSPHNTLSEQALQRGWTPFELYPVTYVRSDVTRLSRWTWMVKRS